MVNSVSRLAGIWPAAAALALVACADHSATEIHSVRAAIRLAEQVTFTKPPARPFVGILDTVVLVVTPENGESSQSFLANINNADTVVIPVGPVKGRAYFDATIRSNNGTLLDSSAHTLSAIDPSTGVVDVSVSPLAPIILAAPDTVKVSLPPQKVVRDSFKLYNRGLGLVNWTISAIAPIPSKTDCSANCLGLINRLGRIAANDSVVVHMDTISAIPTPVTFTISTAQGSVKVVVVRSP